MCYEIKFENRVKDKNNSEVDTKKHRYVSAKASNAALVKLTDSIVKNDHVINCALFFCK